MTEKQIMLERAGLADYRDSLYENAVLGMDEKKIVKKTEGGNVKYVRKIYSILAKEYKKQKIDDRKDLIKAKQLINQIDDTENVSKVQIKALGKQLQLAAVPVIPKIKKRRNGFLAILGGSLAAIGGAFAVDKFANGGEGMSKIQEFLSGHLGGEASGIEAIAPQEQPEYARVAVRQFLDSEMAQGFSNNLDSMSLTANAAVTLPPRTIISPEALAKLNDINEAPQKLINYVDDLAEKANKTRLTVFRELQKAAEHKFSLADIGAGIKKGATKVWETGAEIRAAGEGTGSARTGYSR
jgi:hypothetical protein